MAGSKVSALTELSGTPADDDEVYLRDTSAGSSGSKRFTWLSLKTALGTVFDPNFGVPMTIDPRFYSSTSVMTANQAVYLRAKGGGTITKIGLYIGASSGNLCVAVYANSGSGSAARPAARLATSGSTASPGTGYQEISLGGSVVVPNGSWLAVCADNTTVSFGRAGTNATNIGNLSNGVSQFQNTAFPLPNPAVPSASGSAWSFIMFGVA